MAKLKSNGGEFELNPYSVLDSAPGRDITKTCGADIKITFTPKDSLRSDKITFVQVMKCTKGDGKPLLFTNEEPRATSKAKGDTEDGWCVDRLAGNKHASYQEGNDGKEVPGWGQIGYRKSVKDYKDSTLLDGVRLPRRQGKTFKCEAISYALDKTNNVYLGGVEWGYTVDAAGKAKKTSESIKSMGDPAGVQKEALKRWNEQAKNPDATKRNHADQQPVHVP